MTRILIVDDEEINRFFLKESLENMDYEICGEAGTGLESIEKSRELLPDLIIMDIKMPGELNGIDAAEIITEEMAIPVIFLTAYGDSSYLERIKQSDVYGYLIKPVNLKELQFSIHIALYRKQMELRLESLIKKYKNETYQRGIIYNVLTKINQLIDPLPVLEEILKMSMDFLECDGVAIYHYFKGSKTLIKGQEFVKPEYQHIRIIDEIEGKLLNIDNAKRFYENEVNLPLEIENQFSEVTPEKIIFQILSIEPEVFGYICFYSFEPSVVCDTSKHAFITIISEVISLVMKRHNDFVKIQEQEKQNLKQSEILSRNERLSSLGTLTSAIGHEIYQPLQSIKVLAESILYWDKKNNSEFSKEDVFQNIQKITERVNRIDNIIKSMRSIVNSPTKEHLELLDLNEMIEEILSMYQEEFESNGITLSLKLSPNLPKLLLMHTPFQQLFSNLINNAMQAIQEANPNEKKILVETGNEGNTVFLAISDNGKGIEENQKAQIFEPFFSTKRTKSNMGLGLFLVFNILKSFDATINVENNEMGGATFRINFNKP